MTVFSGRENQFMVDEPFGRTVEESTRGVDVHRGAFDEGLVSLLRILLRCIAEEPRADGLAHGIVISPCRQDLMLVAKNISDYTRARKLSKHTDP